MSRFVAIRTEGGLIPFDTIDTLLRGELPGQKPADFGLERAQHLGDEIARAWSDALDYWHIFRRRMEALSDKDQGTTLTRERWILPVLADLLGYELTYQPSGAQVSGKIYPISHRAGAGEEAPPVHIVGFRQDLDRRDEAGHRRMSPQGLVQEYINRSEHLWGVVTNGLRFRLLRDTTRTARPTYFEFDLQSILEAGRFNEFVVFYRLCHRTRLPKTIDDAKDCLLERYYQASIDEGLRVRDQLRDAVEVALKTIGTGLLQHPSGDGLHSVVKSGQLTPEQYYRELLHLIYRVLFLMVAEERQMVLVPGPEAERRQQIYDRLYSLRRLRDIAERPIEEGPYGDLWAGLQETFRLFTNIDKNPLGIPPLNGHLFGPDAIPHLEGTSLYNHDLLVALRHLSVFEVDGTPNRVNYAGLDVEELGSVYESLLDFHPTLESNDGAFMFDLKTGTERKSTGSYYTPRELVSELVDSALLPGLEGRITRLTSREERETAILTMTVCDPACGSGHFLLAAGRRMARELARIRSAEDEPTPEEFRKALRDVIQHCLHGVDKNPLAVDLCKVALWIEGHNPGMPLSFLDHRIRCGDTLIGISSVAELTEGVPDAAFTAVFGESKECARELRNRNERERRAAGKQLLLMQRRALQATDEFALAYSALSALPDNTVQQVHDKELHYNQLHAEGSSWWYEWMAANLWVSAFFFPLRDGKHDVAPTTGPLRDLLDGLSLSPSALGVSNRLRQDFKFFHWRLEFPEVFSKGGFDVILSNPPFLGGLKISGTLGLKYRHYLIVLYAHFKGTADLCAAFFRRSYSLLKPGGMMGMVATNTIGQGDTRESGLAAILKDGGAIAFAHRFIKWPGTANVEVNLITVGKRTRVTNLRLDGRVVEFISSRLDDEPEIELARLAQNEGKAFIGDYVRGTGFLLPPDEANRLIAERSENGDCVLPYLNGADLNDHPEQSPSRYIICFRNWELERARRYHALLAIVESRVKSEREGLKNRDDRRDREHWWLFARYREDMREALSGLHRALVRSRISEFHQLVFVPTSYVPSEQVVVFVFDDLYHFALLQSSIHEIWVWSQASSLESRNRYTPSDCFDTFPFPPTPSGDSRARAARAAEHYYEHRRQLMLRRHIGLTPTYGLLHSPVCTDQDISELRRLHAEIDRAIYICYGWDTTSLVHGFFKNDRGQIRFTVSSEAKDDVLRKLKVLNRSALELNAPIRLS